MKTKIRCGVMLAVVASCSLLTMPAIASVCVQNHNSGAVVKVVYAGVDKSLILDQTAVFPFVKGNSMEIQGWPNGNTIYVTPNDKDLVEVTGVTEFTVKATQHANVCTDMTAPAAPAKAPAGR